MPKKIIRLCYKKVIDASASTPWEQFVLDDTYSEFLLHVQLYNQQGKYTLFSELITEVPGAEQLHFLVSAAAVNYLKQLNGIIPDVTNVFGKHFLPFKNYRFEIIESDIKDKAVHEVAIHFISEPLIWHDTIENNLLLSVSETAVDTDDALLTNMVALQPMLSIFSFKTILS